VIEHAFTIGSPLGLVMRLEMCLGQDCGPILEIQSCAKAPNNLDSVLKNPIVES
jgi:hypothetical protein